tara:strand:- start:827 stop:973 length:147 start_codon:yes stop_codon:yes gene_type:complete
MFVKAWMREIGKKGGQKRGDSKKRPQSQYEEMGAKSAALRAKRKKGGK